MKNYNPTRKTLAVLTGVLLMACSTTSISQTDEDANDTSPASSQATTNQNAGPCSGSEYRQLDFWLGEWDLTWTQADGTIGTGTNVITQDPYGDCIIMERFDGAPSMQFKGMSVSTYFKPAKMWRQTWVDDQGGFIALYGGPHDDGTFSLETQRLMDKGPYQRMIWEDIKDDRLVWRWQNRQNPDDEWADSWVINYARKTD